MCGEFGNQTQLRFADITLVEVCNGSGLYVLPHGVLQDDAKIAPLLLRQVAKLLFDGIRQIDHHAWRISRYAVPFKALPERPELVDANTYLTANGGRTMRWTRPARTAVPRAGAADNAFGHRRARLPVNAGCYCRTSCLGMRSCKAFS